MWTGGAAGEVGRLIHLAVRWAFGTPGMVVPILLIGLGILQFRRDVDEIGPRLVFATLLTFISSTSLWHLFAGMPSAETGLDALRHAGGVVGATATLNLAKAFSVFGAGFILVVLTIAGVLLLTNTSVATVVGNAHRALDKANHMRLVGQDAFGQWQDKRAEAKALKAERDARFAQEQAAQAAIDAFEEQEAALATGHGTPADSELAPPTFVTDFEADSYGDDPLADGYDVDPYGDEAYAEGLEDDDPNAMTMVDMPRIQAGKPPVERTLLHPSPNITGANARVGRSVPASPNPNAPHRSGGVGAPRTHNNPAPPPPPHLPRFSASGRGLLGLRGHRRRDGSTHLGQRPADEGEQQAEPSH
ncbi:MAG: DNA translocase FtsK 4TM domain-containing protein [Propionibacteriaceae bacterium]|nr:DNA translocase FtsK 4TM domain-containing protein [Propionibacteriaceae bacterium]